MAGSFFQLDLRLLACTWQTIWPVPYLSKQPRLYTYVCSLVGYAEASPLSAAEVEHRRRGSVAGLAREPQVLRRHRGQAGWRGRSCGQEPEPRAPWIRDLTVPPPTHKAPNSSEVFGESLQ